jgi:multisubunit Na+/H+ antiporter MnhB subunit
MKRAAIRLVEGDGSDPVRPVVGLLAVAFTLLLALALGLAVGSLSPEPAGLTAVVQDRLPESGVTQPVTAVLLNFRGYDTWLEIGVLLLAVLSMLAVRQSDDLTDVEELPPPSVFLATTTKLLVPVMVLLAGYLLWLGTHAAGGAFQAGAVLASALVLLRMAGHRSVSAVARRGFLLLLVSGFAVFLAVAVVLLLTGRGLLEFPPRHAGVLILLIESALAAGIGFTLAALFAGGHPAKAASTAARRPEPSGRDAA